MKKYLLALAVAASASTGAMAQLETPVFFSEDFNKMGETHNYVTDGWITYGVDARPIDIIENMFFPEEDADKNAYAILNYGETTIPMACTMFNPAQEADQWLVSPVISIPADNAELKFSACAYAGMGAFGSNAIGENKFEILVSTTGTEKDDFTSVYSDFVKGSATTEIVIKDFLVPLNGYEGKDVHVAFVAGGMNVGMTGFTNILIGNYILEAVNYTPQIGEPGQKYQFRVNLKMKAPVACPGLQGTLYVNDKVVSDEYYKKEFGSASSSYVTQLITLKDAIEIPSESTESVNYRFEIQPDFEGAPTSVLTGTVGVPKVKYPNNVVIEEITATGCGWCPSGAASLNYYHDTYPGTETQGKAIGIAVHGQVNYLDPMSEGIADYLNKLQGMNGNAGYPAAVFNRSTKGQNPWDKRNVESKIDVMSNNLMTIDAVEYPGSDKEEGWEIYGKNVKVKMSARNSYSAEGLPFNICVVLIENGVKGYSSGYTQENYFYNKDASFVTGNYGAYLVPYLEDYLMGGALGKPAISYEDMVYNHVARGCYPSFYGEAIGDTWEADVPQACELEFAVPETVKDWDNVEVVALMLDATDNTIVASDIMESAHFTAVSGIKGVNTESGILISGNGGNLKVSAAEGSKVVVFTLDGRMLANAVVAGDALSLNASAWNGPVVVKVSNNNETKVAKLIF